MPNPRVIAQIRRGGGNPFDYYVDSINGNDGNNGITAGTAFATIGALSGKIANGTRIGLARGSTWREALNVNSYNNIKVAAYGSGARPILDQSLVAANASFTKTVGRANVYEIALSLGGVAQQFVNVYENNTRLVRVANVATCDGTPGSVSVTAEFGNITLYVHASDSSDVTANGKTYEYSGLGGLSMRGSGSTVSGISVRRSILNQGNLSVGQNATITDCLLTAGANHSLQLLGAATVKDTTITDLYSGATAGTLVNINLDNPAGENITITNCTFQYSAPDITNYILNSHNNIAGNFGTLTLVNCTMINGLMAIYGCNNMTAVIATNPTITNCVYSIVNMPLANVTVTGGTVSSNRVGRLVQVGAGGSMTISGVAFTHSRNGQSGSIFVNGAGVLSITDCSYAYTNSGGVALAYCNSAVANITLLRNTYSGDVTTIYEWTAGAVGMTWASDYNDFNSGYNMSILGILYNNLAVYQAGTGQDAHST